MKIKYLLLTLMTVISVSFAFSCSSLETDEPDTEQAGDKDDDNTGEDDGTGEENPGTDDGNEENPGGDDEDGDVVNPPAGDSGQDGSGETDGYRLVWQDLFDGQSLDMSKWVIEVNGNGGGNNELQYYREENISVGDDGNGNGCLIITARRESYAGKSFTSGRLNTSGKYEFTHGKVEASIMLPKTADGLWPAFWLLGADIATNPWPKCGDIDIMEMGNAAGISAGTQDRYFNGAAHWGYYRDGAYPNYAKASTNSYSLQDGQYHLYTLIWDDTMLRMYLDLDKYPDAQPYYEMGITEKGDDWGTGHYFHHDFYILFNLAVGGNFPNIHNAAGITALPDDGSEARMYVNYVKVYQK